MMLPTIAPRTVFYVAHDGSQKSITINFEFGPEEIVDLGDGDEIIQLRAYAFVTSPLMTSKLEAIGFDQMQTLARLMNVTDIWIQKVCRDTEVTLFTIGPDRPVSGPMAVFL